MVWIPRPFHSRFLARRKIGESTYLCGHFKEVFIISPLLFFNDKYDLLICSGYYSHLISLYRSLGVRFRQADFSYSFSSLFLSTNAYSRRITTTFIYNGGSGRAGLGKPSSLGGGSKNLELLASTIQRARATGLFVCLTVQLLLCYIITIFHAVPIWRSTSISSTVFRDWAMQTKSRGFLAKWCGMDVVWQNYIYSVLLPLLCAVCTAPEEDVMNYPMEEILGTL